MIGHFEHEFLRFKKNHLKNLIALAKADGHLHDKEKKLIYKIGQKYQLKERQVDSLLKSNKKFELHIPDSHEDRLNQLYDLMLMVYADGVVDKNEVKFCKDVINRFGYDKKLFGDLLEIFENGNPPDPDLWTKFVEGATKHSLN